MCSGSIEFSQYFVLTPGHDMPSRLDGLVAQSMVNGKMLEGVSAASVADSASEPGKDLSGKVICTEMGKPEIPAVRFTSREPFTFKAETWVEVRDGQIGYIDAKVLAGSADVKVNQLFLDSIIDMIRNTYKCEGTHVFELRTTIVGTPRR